MVAIEIWIGMDGKFPIIEKRTGLAKNESVAKWMFAYCGWANPDGKAYPTLAIEVKRIDWPEGDLYFSANYLEWWSLGNRLHMN